MTYHLAIHTHVYLYKNLYQNAWGYIMLTNYCFAYCVIVDFYETLDLSILSNGIDKWRGNLKSVLIS